MIVFSAKDASHGEKGEARPGTGRAGRWRTSSNGGGAGKDIQDQVPPDDPGDKNSPQGGVGVGG